MPGICLVVENDVICGRPVYGLGYCGKHYQRNRKYGDPLIVKPKGWDTATSLRRYWSNVDKDGSIPEYRPDLGSCWLWTAKCDDDGYGRCGFNAKTNVGAHRVAYELLVSSIPVGLVIDHLCRNRKCVNPDHLEAVTTRENILRGFAPPALNVTKTHCLRGHEFTPENTRVTKDGKRSCKTCSNDLRRLRRSSGSR